MEEVFINIMEQIAREMPELSLIDEDYGQLEMGANEDHYPVTFPCVLIGNVDSDWHDLGYGAQNSDSRITVRLAIDCYDDTHYSSGTYDKAKERQQMANKLYKTLQCFECSENTSPLVREKSRDYTLPGYIKVYDFTFSFTLHDESAMEE
jgi:hypothetical protein